MIDTFYLPGRVCSTQAIREIAGKASAPYTMICLKPDIEWVYLGQERMSQVLEMTGAVMVYADHFNKSVADGQWSITEAPVIDYQSGALRDDFDFGAVLLWDTAKLKALVAQMDENYEFAYQSRVGQALNGLWGLQSEGFFQSQSEIDAAPKQTFGDVKPGDIRYKDQNGDGKIDSNDEVFLGRWDSPFIGGINLTLKWKNFTFFALGNLYLGGYGMKDNTYYWMRGQGKYSEIARDTWTPQNTGAAYPRLTTTNGDNNYRYSDFWMYKTDRFNLRKVQLTYNICGGVFENTFAKFIKGIDVYVSANNQLTIAKERKILEMNVGSAPQTRYYSIGFKAMF